LARIIWKESISGIRDFERMLSNPKENIKALLGEDFSVMKRIILRLVDPISVNSFPNAAILAEAFRKLLSDYLVPLGVREMAVGGAHRTLTQPREKVYLSERAYEVVAHPVFQRLHHLNQLNYVYMLYSGAKHSRFLHSLCTYEMAKRYIEGLLGSSYFKYLMYKEDYELLLIAALLHDVGQYPLSHAIEDLEDEQFTGVVTSVKPDFQMFRYFLTLKVKGCEKTISDILKSGWGMDLERLSRILSRDPLSNETDYFIRSIIDGSIDIDKVSYLIYDSYFTGAPYGLGIDLPGLLSSLVAIPPDISEDRHAQIGVLDTGVVAAEGVIAARYSMFSRVYWHHFNRAIMAMLKYAAAKLFLSSNDGCSFESYINDTFYSSDLQAVHYLHKCLGVAMQLRDVNPLSGLLDSTRTVHRRLLTFSGRTGSATGSIYRLLVRCNFKNLENFRKQSIEILSTVLDHKLDDFDLLFDVPKAEKRRDTLEDLYVYDSEGRGEKYKKLSEYSAVTKALCAEFEDHTKKCRIFVSDRVSKELDKNKNLLNQAREKIEGNLKDCSNTYGT
jgi:HD superfamily phosphohydrolase